MNRAQSAASLIEIGRQLADLARKTPSLAALADNYIGRYEEIRTWKRQRAALPAPDDPCLTPRERMVVALAVEGVGDRIIGKKLGIATGTVKLHLKHARERAGIRGVLPAEDGIV